MIINSILDIDFYKLTMMQAVCQLYPYAKARYEFIDRNGMDWPDGFDEVVWQHVENMPALALTQHEEDELRKHCPYFTPVFLNALSNYRFDPNEVSVSMEGGKLSVSIQGAWWRTILWEVPLLAMISELYYKHTKWEPTITKDEIKTRLVRKGARIAGKFIEFGTRRRFSQANQSEVYRLMRKHATWYTRDCIGTSNVALAMDSDSAPIGTMAHEWIMFHGAKYGYRTANLAALKRWVDVYQGNLGIALTDTYGSDNFFKSFNLFHSKLYDGIRQDSGDPIEFAHKAIDHYEKHGIDPRTKTIVFSDSLDSLEKIENIHAACNGRIQDIYGIGTWLSNDVGAPKLNIVIKMTACKPRDMDWTPTVKLSDDVGKHTGDKDEIVSCKQALGL